MVYEVWDEGYLELFKDMVPQMKAVNCLRELYVIRPLKTCSSPRRAVRSHSLVCSKKSILIVGIGPILNKELELIFRSDRSDRTCVYS